MPEAGPLSNKFSLNSEDSSVIVVTSIKPIRRPMTLRQQRLNEFCISQSCRKRLKEASRRDTVNSASARVRDNVAARTVATMTAPLNNLLHQCLAYPKKGQGEDQLQDDVKVLYPPRNLLYSDSDVTLLSSCSSWCAYRPGNQDASTSMLSETLSSVNEVPPRPYGRIGLEDGSSGVTDRYLNKPPVGFVPSEDLVTISEETERREMEKPYRQVWHSLWEHHIGSKSVRNSKSANKIKPASQFVSEKMQTPQQITASENHICVDGIGKRKQRRGVPPVAQMAQIRMRYRSKTANRSSRRPFFQGAYSIGSRVAQARGSSARDDVLEDSLSLFEKKPKSRRREQSDKKNLLRAIATKSPGPVVLAADKENCKSFSESKSAPPSSKKGVTEISNNSSCLQGKPTKWLDRPRFSVPIKASRVPMELLFKEMVAQKSECVRKDSRTKGRQRIAGCLTAATATNSKELLVPDEYREPSSGRDTKLAVHFKLPVCSRPSSSQNGRRLCSPPLHNQVDLNLNEIEADSNYSLVREADRISIPSASNFSDTAPPQSPLKQNPPGWFAERAVHQQNVPTLPIQNRFYHHPVISKHSSVKSSHIYNGNMEPLSNYQPHTSANMPIAVPPGFLVDGKAVPNQTSAAFRPSHPNAADVLVSPPPNLQMRGGTMSVQSTVSDGEASTGTVYNPCVHTVNMPRYYNSPSPGKTIEDNFVPVQPLSPQNLPFRPFRPSVDFSSFEPPPRPLSTAIYSSRETSPRSFEGNSAFPTNLQPENTQLSYLILPQQKAKPLKELLTFSAQVPSPPYISPLLFTSKGSKPSPDTPNTTNYDTFNPSFTNVHIKDSPSDCKDDWLNFNPIKPCPLLEPLTKQIKLSTSIESEVSSYSACVEGKLLIKEKENTFSILDGKSPPWKLLPQTKADLETDYLSTSMSPREDNVSDKILGTNFDLDARDIDLKVPKSSDRILNNGTCSDANLITVTEVRAEAQHLGNCHVTEVSDLKVNPSLALGIPTIAYLKTGIERTDNVNTDELKNCSMKCAFNNLNNEDVSVCSDLLAPSVINRDEGGNDRKSILKGPCRVSFVQPPEKDNLVSSVGDIDQQITQKKIGFTEGTTKLVDGIWGDNQIANIPYSTNTSQSGSHFESLVARLENIALHCKLPGSEPGSDCSKTQPSCPILQSKQEKNIERSNAFVQVPVVCSRSVETEPFSTEKCVPDFHASLTLKVMSSVVDVPPVMKEAESIGINTEYKLTDLSTSTEKDGSVSSTKKHNSRLTFNHPLHTTSANAADSSFKSNHLQPMVSALITDKHIKLLKPFFRSHLDELANIYSVAAVHSLSLNSEKEDCSVLSRDDQLRTKSEKHTERGLSSSDDVQNDFYEEEQPRRAPKKHVAERLLSFRPVRRETNITCPPRDAREDERPEQIPEGDFLLREDGNSCQGVGSSAEELRKMDEMDDSRLETSRAFERIDVDSSGRIGGRKISCCRGKWREPSELIRSSCEDFITDKGIAFKRKPCRGFRQKIPSSKIKGTLNLGYDAAGKCKPPDIPGSIVMFALSNIATPANTDSKRDFTSSATAKTEETPQVRRHKFRRTVKDIQKVATMIEASKKPKSLTSDDGAKFREERSAVVVHNSVTIKNLNKDCTSDSSDCHTFLTYPRGSDRSIVPIICLTRAESNDVEVESSSTPSSTTSVQVAFRAVKPFTEDIEGPDNSHCLVPSSQNSTCPCFDAPSRTVEGNTSIGDSFMVRDTVRPKTIESTEKNAFQEYSEEDPTFAFKTSLSNAVKDFQSDVKEMDSEQLSRGCMFTAMRRFMKNRSGPVPSAHEYHQCEDDYSGFQCTGIPFFMCPMDTTRFDRHRNLKHIKDHDWSPAVLEDLLAISEWSRRCTPIRRTWSSSRGQGCTVGVGDEENLGSDSGKDQDNGAVSSQCKRCALNKTTHSGCHQLLRRERCAESKPCSSPYQDPWDGGETETESSGKSESIIQGDLSHKFCPCAFGGRCPESPQSSKHMLMYALPNNEDDVYKTVSAIRTLPFDIASAKAFQIKRERCAASLPRSSIFSKKSCARASSSPAGQVRVSSGRHWQQFQSIYNRPREPRRLMPELLECDNITCDRFEHKKTGHSIPSRLCDNPLRRCKENEAFLVFADDSDLDDVYTMKQCSFHTSRKADRE